MARLTTGVLLILAGITLAAWNEPRIEACEPPAGTAERPPAPEPRLESSPTRATQPEVDEGKAQPPGRDDPNEFYKKAPRKPRQLRRVYAGLPPVIATRG